MEGSESKAPDVSLTLPPKPDQGRKSQPSVAHPSVEGEEMLNLDIFSMRRPKNLVAGAASGIKSFLRGVVTGACGFVAAPLVGFQTNGCQGLWSGLAAGVMGAIALPCAGAAVATMQIGRGLINSCEQMVSSCLRCDVPQAHRCVLCHIMCLCHGHLPLSGREQRGQRLGPGEKRMV